MIQYIMMAQIIWSNAGWSTNVWPSTNNIRFISTNAMMQVTNLNAYAVRDIWTFTSGPDGFRPSQISDLDWAGFLEDVITKGQPVSGNELVTSLIITNDYYYDINFDVAHPTATYTNYFTNLNLFPVTVTIQVERVHSGVTTSLLLNVADVWALESVQAVNERLNFLAETQTFARLMRNTYATNSGTPPRGIGIEAFNIRDTLIEVKAQIESIYQKWYDPQDNYPAWFADTANWVRVWGDTNLDLTNDTWGYFGSPGAGPGTNIQRQVGPILTAKRIADAIPGFPISTNTATVTNNVPGWFAGSNTTYEITNWVYTQTTYTTKWFDYTPSRAADLGGWNQGLSGIQTGSWSYMLYGGRYSGTTTWEIVNNCGETLTNQVVDNDTNLTLLITHEDSYQVYSNDWTGNLKTTLTFTCTNTAMDPYYSADEYGYKHVPALLDLMTDYYKNYSNNPASDGWQAGTNNSKSVLTSASSTWANAKSGAENAYTGASAGTLTFPVINNYGEGYTNASSTNYIAGLKYAYGVLAATMPTTNYTGTVDFFGMVDEYETAYIDDNFREETYILDDLGITLTSDTNGWSATNYFFFGSVGFTNSSNVTLVYLSTNINANMPTNPWVSQPDFTKTAGIGPGEVRRRGFEFENTDIIRIYKPQFTYTNAP